MYETLRVGLDLWIIPPFFIYLSFGLMEFAFFLVFVYLLQFMLFCFILPGTAACETELKIVYSNAKFVILLSFSFFRPNGVVQFSTIGWIGYISIWWGPLF